MRNASSDFASLKSAAAMILRSTSRWKSIGFAPPWAIHKIVSKSESMKLIIRKAQHIITTMLFAINTWTSGPPSIVKSGLPAARATSFLRPEVWDDGSPTMHRLGIYVCHLVHTIHQSLVLVTLNGKLLHDSRWKTRTIPRQNTQRRGGRKFLRARLGRRIRALVPPRVNHILNVCNRLLVILCENPAVFDWRCHCHIPRLQWDRSLRVRTLQTLSDFNGNKWVAKQMSYKKLT